MDAVGLLTNHRTKLIFPSGLSDLSTIEYISALVGDEHVRSEVDEPKRGQTPEQSAGTSPASAVPLLAPSVLRRMAVGDGVLIHGSMPPAWTRALRRVH